MGAPVVRRARAFAPCHVTGAFLPRTEARDPRGRGSVGVGLVLDVGVRADAAWRPAHRPRLSLTADVPGSLDVSGEVARRLLAERPGSLTVRLRHDLPVGQGFGTSAAGALATGLAVGAAVGVPRRRVVEIAHLADLFGGGGLGGVAAALGGGLEARVAPGIPPWGRIVRRPVSSALLVAVLGPPIASRTVLGRPQRLTEIAAAYRPLAGLARPPSLDEFWSASERFTDRLGWAPAEVRAALRGIRRRGGRAAQAMFGRSVFASLPSGPRRAELLGWLARRGVRAVEVGVGRRGAGRRPATARP